MPEINVTKFNLEIENHQTTDITETNNNIKNKGLIIHKIGARCGIEHYHKWLLKVDNLILYI